MLSLVGAKKLIRGGASSNENSIDQASWKHRIVTIHRYYVRLCGASIEC